MTVQSETFALDTIKLKMQQRGAGKEASELPLPEHLSKCSTAHGMADPPKTRHTLAAVQPAGQC